MYEQYNKKVMYLASQKDVGIYKLQQSRNVIKTQSNTYVEQDLYKAATLETKKYKGR
jgi:hypothetical protein